ncbi:MAG: hypothetical protein ABIK38_04405 [candidate division WOR-3 bacterium]
MDIEEENKNRGANRGRRIPNPEGVARELEARCQELGVRVIYDDLRGEGGICRVRDRLMVIINRRVSVQTRIRMLETALQRAERSVFVSSTEKSQPGQTAVADPAGVRKKGN